MRGQPPPIWPFELDPRTGRFETVEETPEAPAEPVLPPAPPPRPFWHRPGVLLLASIIGLVLIQAIVHVMGLIQTTPFLGWPFAVLLAVVVFTALGTLWKEVFDLRRVRRAERLRLTGLRLTASELHGEAVGFIEDLDRQLGEHHKAEIRAAAERGLADAEILALYERRVLGPRDKRAYRLVLEASRDIGLLTALSPLGLLDGVLVLWRTIMMIRGIARAYGLALGPTAAFGMLRRCIRNAAIAGLADVVSHAAIEHVGASLAALLSARAGQGAGNALLAGRLGLEAIRLTRPLPFIAEPQPRLSHVRAAIFDSAGKVKPEPVRPERSG